MVAKSIRPLSSLSSMASEKMHYLEDLLDINQVVTFGSIRNRYDIVIEPSDTNKVVPELIKDLNRLRNLVYKGI